MGDPLEKYQSLRLLSRLVRIVVSGLVVMVCIYAVIAWILINYSKQVDAVVWDKWAFRLFDANTRVLAVILAGDRDSDGVCDGIELATRSDPKNPKDQSFVLEPGGMRMSVYDARNIGVELHAGEHRNQLLQPGERRTVRIRLVNILEDILEWPVVSHELRVRIHPSLSSLAGIPGGAVSSMPVDVQVEKNGILVFDLQAAAGVVPDLNDPNQWEYIDLKNAVTGEEIGQFRFGRSWRRPTVSPATEILREPDTAIDNSSLLSRWDAYRTTRVSWADSDKSVSGFLLEVAEDQPNGDWFGVQTYPSTETSATIAQGIRSTLFLHHGPLKYRIVPLSREPAQP